MKNSTVFESNCNCFPVHVIENQRKLTRLLFHFLLALHFAHSIGSLFIFRPFRIYEGCSALIIRQTFSLVLAMVTQNVFAPFHVIGLLSNFASDFPIDFSAFDCALGLFDGVYY